MTSREHPEDLKHRLATNTGPLRIRPGPSENHQGCPEASKNTLWALRGPPEHPQGPSKVPLRTFKHAPSTPKGPPEDPQRAPRTSWKAKIQVISIQHPRNCDNSDAKIMRSGNLTIEKSRNAKIRKSTLPQKKKGSAAWASAI